MTYTMTVIDGLREENEKLRRLICAQNELYTKLSAEFRKQTGRTFIPGLGNKPGRYLAEGEK